MLWRLTKGLAYLAVLVALAVHLGFVALQNLGGLPVWLGELTRFLPFYWLLGLLCAALALSLFLRPLWRVLAVCNLALFAFGTLDFHWNATKTQSAAGTPVRVLTYNMKALNVWMTRAGFDGIEREIQNYAPDIVAFQDAQWWLTRDDEWTNTPTVISRPIAGLPHVVAFGQFVVASRFALTDCAVGNLSGIGSAPSLFQQCSANQYLQCKVRIGSNDVQLVAVHLVSPRGALMAARHNFPRGLQDWQIHVAERLAQASTLRADLSALPRPQIVMGDFNTAQQSPVFATLEQAGLRDAFAEAGQGWGYTHGHGLSRGLDLYRIDHILVSPEVAVQNAAVGSVEESEHNPVMADLVLP